MPDRESRDKRGRAPRRPAWIQGDGFQPDGQSGGGYLDHKGRAPLPDASATRQADLQTSDYDRPSDDSELGRRNLCAYGSDEAFPHPRETPDGVLRGSCDIVTTRVGSEGTPRENPAVPTAVARGN